MISMCSYNCSIFVIDFVIYLCNDIIIIISSLYLYASEQRGEAKIFGSGDH